jgi:hypothetical protein
MLLLLIKEKIFFIIKNIYKSKLYYKEREPSYRMTKLY